MTESKSKTQRQLDFFEGKAPRFLAVLVVALTVGLGLFIKLKGLSPVVQWASFCMAPVAPVFEFFRRGIKQELPADERLARHWSLLWLAILTLLAMTLVGLIGLIIENNMF